MLFNATCIRTICGKQNGNGEDDQDVEDGEDDVDDNFDHGDDDGDHDDE